MNDLLSVQAYAALQPHIPVSELFASSICHPDDGNMHWLLHSKRVPRTETRDEKAQFCAGIGLKDKPAWSCLSCIRHLCLVSGPQMPPLCLANLNWLGREHPSFQTLSLGTKLLLGKGRPVLRQVFLGKGKASESYTGLIGNTILLAQAAVETAQILPSINKLLDTLVIVFCKSVDEVRACKALTVNRHHYLECLQIRKNICPAFFDVKIDNDAVKDLPLNAVPDFFIQHAVHVPETEYIQKMDGPGDVAMGTSHSNEKEHDLDLAETDKEIGIAHEPKSSELLPETELLEQEENKPDVMIGIDYQQDPKPAQLFQALQIKLQHLQKEAGKLVAEAAQEKTWEEITATVRQVGQEEHCNRIVIDIQDTMKKLLRENKNLDDVASSLLNVNQGLHVDAFAVPTSKVLSSFDPLTFSSCFTEFFYGDAVPGLPNRPNPEVSYQDLFSALMQREEMEYSCPEDSSPYRARKVSRFDAPEFAAMFGDLLRRMKTLQAVRGTFQRQGFEKDLKLIASAKTDDFLQAACAESTASTLQIARCDQTPHNVQVALRHMLFSTANVPLTEGYKVRLRHLGHSYNYCFGPMSVFCTHNYSDTQNPLMHECVSPGSSDLSLEKPTLPPLQKMHELVAAHPACTAKFFMLMEELNFRHLYGIDSMKLGRHNIPKTLMQFSQEDDFATSGVPGLAGFATAAFEPLEAQGRGFQHGHRKVCGLPSPLPELQEDILVHSTNMDDELPDKISAHNQSVISKVPTLQYEDATLPGKQLGITMAPEPFTALQQRQCKFDGGLEPDQSTKRLLLPIVPKEPLSHIKLETTLAEQHQRPLKNIFREVPLTGSEISVLPKYRLPAVYPETATEIPESAFRGKFDASGKMVELLDDAGQPVSITQLQEEAQSWQKHFASDFRLLHCHTHNHECSATCLKNMRKTLQEKSAMLKPHRAPLCRFLFYHIAEFAGKRVRRRGKYPVEEAVMVVGQDPQHLGLVAVPRAHPFRSATSDVTMVCCRCNCDFKCLCRGVILEDEDSVIIKCSDAMLACVLGISLRRFREKNSTHLRRFARCIITMHVANYICDHYITKYSTKPMEHLQSLTNQYAVGIRRLEVEEDEREQPFDEKYRAKRITIRLAAAANRSSWVSSTELATTILCDGHCWTSHSEVVLFISRAWFLMNECKRILEKRQEIIVEPAEAPLDFVEIAEDTEDLVEGEGDEMSHASANETADETEKEENHFWERIELRTTTTLHDDYLHRGHWLIDMPFFVYATRIRRIRKPKSIDTEDAQLFFAFAPHYPLSTLYCQTIAYQITVPRLVGPQMPSADNFEDQAAFLSMLFLPIHCRGPTCCSDPLNNKVAMCPLKIGNPKQSCASSWKATKARMDLVTKTAKRKIFASQKISVIHDTSLIKQWWDETKPCGKNDGQAMQMRAVLHQLLAAKVNQSRRTLFEILCSYLGLQCGAHKDQLSLEEFVALESQRFYKNILLQYLARTKPLQAGQKVTKSQEEAESSQDETKNEIAQEEKNTGGR